MYYLINRLRFLFLFIVLFLFCLFKAISAQLGWTNLSGIIFGVLIITSLLIIGHKERLLIILSGSILFIAFGLHFLNIYFDIMVIDVLRLVLIIAFLLVMTSLCLYYTSQDKTISITTLFGSISSYLLIGLIFAYLYLLVELLSPQSFTALNLDDEVKAIYFSFITLTTVGFGEIVPLKPIAQTLTWFESFSGQLYLAIIIGQLVGRYTSEQTKGKSYIIND